MYEINEMNEKILSFDTMISILDMCKEVVEEEYIHFVRETRKKRRELK